MRVRIGGAWGFAAARGEGPGRRRARPRARPRGGRRPRPAARARAPARPRAAGTGPPRERDASAIRSRSRSRRSSALLVGRRRRAARRPARARREPRVLVAFRDEPVFASTDGALSSSDRPSAAAGIAATAVDDEGTQVRSYPGSHGGGSPGRLRARARRSTSCGARAAGGRGGGRAALRAALPGRTRPRSILDGEQLALQLHESVGPRRGARPRARPGGGVRGHELPRAGRRRRLRYGSRLMNVTADATMPGRPRLLPLGRRRRRGAPLPARARGRARGLPLLARVGRRVGARALERLHARRGLRPPAARAHDQREPRARRRGLARGPRRRHRRRPAVRDQPLVVDRPTAAALPVRHRAGVGDPRRRARPAASRTRATPA